MVTNILGSIPTDFYTNRYDGNILSSRVQHVQGLIVCGAILKLRGRDHLPRWRDISDTKTTLVDSNRYPIDAVDTGRISVRRRSEPERTQRQSSRSCLLCSTLRAYETWGWVYAKNNTNKKINRKCVGNAEVDLRQVYIMCTII